MSGTADNDGELTSVVRGDAEVSAYTMTLACADDAAVSSSFDFRVSYTLAPTRSPTTLAPTTARPTTLAPTTADPSAAPTRPPTTARPSPPPTPAPTPRPGNPTASPLPPTPGPTPGPTTAAPTAAPTVTPCAVLRAAGLVRAAPAARAAAFSATGAEVVVELDAESDMGGAAAGEVVDCAQVLAFAGADGAACYWSSGFVVTADVSAALRAGKG